MIRVACSDPIQLRRPFVAQVFERHSEGLRDFAWIGKVGISLRNHLK